MLAVWSFWSPPSAPDFSARWPAAEFHLMSWVLSVFQAQKIFDRTSLVTDSVGANILVEKLGLHFDEVNICFDGIQNDYKRYWALGKLHAYNLQKLPFIHMDSDVYFWKQLPSRIVEADFLAQNTEKILNKQCYRHDAVMNYLRENGGWIPKEVEWYLKIRGNEAVCCGVLGGKNIELLNEYSSIAIEFIDRNHHYLRNIQNDIEINIIFEQYILSAFLYYGLAHSKSKFGALKLEYLFSSEHEARSTDAASILGYTHVLAGAKRSALVVEKISNRIQREYPRFYERCLLVSKEISTGIIKI